VLGALAAFLAALAAACAIAGWSEARAAEKALVPPGSADQSMKKAVWGAMEHKGASLFPWYRHLGMGIFQTQARWDQIAGGGRPTQPTDPDDPAYVWPDYLDRVIEESESYGMRVLIQLIGTPGWANGGNDWPWMPTHPSDFADFATAIARRYPSVDLWMIWGEPNRKPNFQPFKGARPTARKLNRKQQRAPRNYAKLLDAAYGALKADDPNNLVIGGNTYFSGGRAQIIRPYPWIRYMKLPFGGRPRMDMWGHNPYSYREPNLKSRPSPKGRVDFSDLRRLAKALDKTFGRRPRLPLFLSEFGVPTKRDLDFKFFVKPKVSGKWVRAAMRIVRRWNRIYTLGWSVPVDTFRNPQGLLDSDLNPKPAYRAFKDG
jgi:hypothetical protein